MTELKSWFKENQTLVLFLVAQAVAIGAAGASIIAYYVRMETRVEIMETRGAAYTVERMSRMEQRITVLEQSVKRNDASIERIVDTMTRELGKTVPMPPRNP
jgi:hypothetical protein